MKMEIDAEHLTRNPDESSKVMDKLRKDKIDKSTKSPPQPCKADNQSHRLYPDLPEEEDSYSSPDKSDNDEDYTSEENISGSPNLRQLSNKCKKQVNLATNNIRQFAEPEDIRSEEIGSSFNPWLILLFVAFAVLLAITFNLHKLNITQNDSSKSYTSKEIIESLKNSFSQQPSLSLKIIAASIEKVINTTSPGPTQPSVILLLSSKNSEETSNCFSTKLAKLISFPNKDYYIMNGLELQKKVPSVAKLSLEKMIQTACNSNKIVVLLKDLDKVPAEASLILTSYFDHENAPYKKIVYIIPIVIKGSIPKSADSSIFDRLAYSHLEQAWHNLDKDNLSAVLSRITVSVAAIFPDNSSKNNC